MNRKQRVALNVEGSSLASMNAGVAQVLTLSPLYF